MDGVAVRGRVVDICMLSRPREGRGAALGLETAIRPGRLCKSTGRRGTGLANPNAGTVSMDRRGGVQRGVGMNPHRESWIFQK